MPKRLPAKPPSVGALQPQDTRQELMRAAGLTPERQGELLRKSVELAETAMDTAMSALPNSTEPDWHARLGAARFIAGLLGAQPSKSAQGAGAGQVIVNIELPEWAAPGPKVIGHFSTKDVLSSSHQS